MNSVRSNSLIFMYQRYTTRLQKINGWKIRVCGIIWFEKVYCILYSFSIMEWFLGLWCITLWTLQNKKANCISCTTLWPLSSSRFDFMYTYECKPRLKLIQNRFQLSAGLNLEKLNTILSGTNHSWAAT